jgi:Ca2+-binding EF-hand superfamily protein
MHPKDSEIRDMIKEADKTKSGSIDFRAFVDVITKKIGKLDSEAEILKAFNTFDKQDHGEISVDELRRALCSMGDALSDKDFREVVRVAGDNDGTVDYAKFTKVMVGSRKSAEDEE